MKNVDNWKPTKYARHRGRLRASRDLAEVSIASRLISDRVAEHYDRYLKDHCRGDLLDLGCGKVPLYLAYRDLAASITCVDWGASPHDVSHADVLCDLNQPIPLSDDSFDTVILSDVLEHLFRPQLLMGEVARMLRPGGALLMNVPFMYWLHEQPHDYYRYTRFALERMATEAGLEIVLIEELGGAVDVLADMTAKLANRLPVVGSFLASLLQTTFGQLGRTRFAKRRLGMGTLPIPLGYFMVARLPALAAPSPTAPPQGIDS